MQCLKIQSVGCVKVGTYGFRVVVYHYGLITQSVYCPRAMYTAVVKFYALTYTDRSRSDYKYFVIAVIYNLVLIVIG